MAIGTRRGGNLIGGARPVLILCCMISVFPRSDFDFEKTAACFKNKILTDLASSGDKSFMQEWYISCIWSGIGVLAKFVDFTVRVLWQSLVLFSI